MSYEDAATGPETADGVSPIFPAELPMKYPTGSPLIAFPQTQCIDAIDIAERGIESAFAAIAAFQSAQEATWRPRRFWRWLLLPYEAVRRPITRATAALLYDLEECLRAFDRGNIQEVVEVAAAVAEEEARGEIDEQKEELRDEIGEAIFEILRRSSDKNLRDRLRVFAEKLKTDSSSAWNTRQIEARICQLFPE